MRYLFVAFLSVLTHNALAEGLNQPIKVNNELSTEIAIAQQPRISIRSIGVLDVDGADTLVIIADVPDSSRNDTTATPAAATGNRRIDCDVEDIDPFRVNTRVFQCDTDELLLGATNRVCIGYAEAFQFGLDEDLTVFEENRCIDFLYLP